MPTYDYKCKKCGKVSEVSHAMTADPRVRCPKCGGATQRVISGGLGALFKGPGFSTRSSQSRSARRPPCGRDAACERCPALED